MFHKLESMRGIAAVLVVLYHSPFLLFDSELSFIAGSWIFVDFFFVLSGFVMTHAYARRVQEGMSFKSYLSARFFRLYPLHFVVLLAWVPFIGVKYYLYNAGYGGTDPALTENVQTFLSSLLLLHSLGFPGWHVASWSISAEWVAYIVFFFLVLFAGSKKLGFIALVLAILIYIASYYFRGAFYQYTWDYGVLRCIPAFMVGCFLYRLVNGVGPQKRVRHLELIAFVLVVASVSLVGLNNYAGYIAIGVFVFSIYVLSSTQSGFIGRCLEYSLIRRVGTYSYSIYMVHMLFLTGFSDILEHILKVDISTLTFYQSFLCNVALLLVVYIVASFTYKYVEIPGKTLGKKLFVG